MIVFSRYAATFWLLATYASTGSKGQANDKVRDAVGQHLPVPLVLCKDLASEQEQAYPESTVPAGRNFSMEGKQDRFSMEDRKVRDAFHSLAPSRGGGGKEKESTKRFGRKEKSWTEEEG